LARRLGGHAHAYGSQRRRFDRDRLLIDEIVREGARRMLCCGAGGAPEDRTARSQDRDRRYLQHRGQRPGQGRYQDVRQAIRREVPKAVEKITRDEGVLLAFYDYPAEHWIHLRTTNPIESPFATVRLRTRVTRGAGSRLAAPAMTFTLIESAQQRWRAVNAPHLVALVRAGARFEHGKLVERPQTTAA
jgi:Transposase, Mutator family